MGYGLGSTYAFTILDGEKEIRIEGAAIGPALSDREREVGRATLERDAEQAGVRPAHLPYGLPDRKPPVQAIFFDTVGRLWVELSREDGAPKVADVWSKTGELLKRVQWDSEITLGFPGSVGEDTALGVRRDSLGVEYVVRLNF